VPTENYDIWDNMAINNIINKKYHIVGIISKSSAFHQSRK
jgi:hypothetical protein